MRGILEAHLGRQAGDRNILADDRHAAERNSHALAKIADHVAAGKGPGIEFEKAHLAGTENIVEFFELFAIGREAGRDSQAPDRAMLELLLHGAGNIGGRRPHIGDHRDVIIAMRLQVSLERDQIFRRHEHDALARDDQRPALGCRHRTVEIGPCPFRHFGRFHLAALGHFPDNMGGAARMKDRGDGHAVIWPVLDAGVIEIVVVEILQAILDRRGSGFVHPDMQNTFGHLELLFIGNVGRAGPSLSLSDYWGEA